MRKLTKNQKKVEGLYDLKQKYKIDDAVEMVKNLTFTKFDASIDIAVHLNVDPKKADQMLRGTVVLPNGTGKVKRVLVLCSGDKIQDALDAGADFAGNDDYIKKIQDGWFDFDVIVTMPAMMAKVGKLGKILGPKGLMPNPKSGTITTDVVKAVKDIKLGKIEYRVDKFGVIHNSVGRVSFENKKLIENVKELISTLIKAKPASVKGVYIKSISLASTMSKGVFVSHDM
jgi:large subunit ribosomal protein L1